MHALGKFSRWQSLEDARAFAGANIFRSSSGGCDWCLSLCVTSGLGGPRFCQPCRWSSTGLHSYALGILVRGNFLPLMIFWQDFCAGWEGCWGGLGAGKPSPQRSGISRIQEPNPSNRYQYHWKLAPHQKPRRWSASCSMSYN